MPARSRRRILTDILASRSHWHGLGRRPEEMRESENLFVDALILRSTLPFAECELTPEEVACRFVVAPSLYGLLLSHSRFAPLGLRLRRTQRASWRATNVVRMTFVSSR